MHEKRPDDDVWLLTPATKLLICEHECPATSMCHCRRGVGFLTASWPVGPGEAGREGRRLDVGGRLTKHTALVVVRTGPVINMNYKCRRRRLRRYGQLSSTLAGDVRTSERRLMAWNGRRRREMIGMLQRSPAPSSRLT